MKSPYRVSNKQSFTHNASWIAFSTVSFTTQSAALSIQPEEGQRPWLIQKWLRHDLLWLSLTSLATIEFISLSFRAPDQRVDLTVPIFFLPKTGNNRVQLWIHDLNLNPQYNWHIYPLNVKILELERERLQPWWVCIMLDPGSAFLGSVYCLSLSLTRLLSKQQIILLSTHSPCAKMIITEAAAEEAFLSPTDFSNQSLSVSLSHCCEIWGWHCSYFSFALPKIDN